MSVTLIFLNILCNLQIKPFNCLNLHNNFLKFISHFGVSATSRGKEENSMELILIIGAVLIGLFILKSLAGMVKLVVKIAIYALIGLAVYRALVHLGVNIC